ncbi:porin family protein [Poritiphilus flavus]|uniref:tRNA modification GTPase n=1 Tax=Poritiphilus flavus TaxID=2697053 RepID=A0A6L9ECY9_9FLAO|nr:tRNA modification GTPase [Poritiphilus flavus]NAS12614.1 tRNA modification GTPase [Poritiphilus flavus]
MNKFIPLAFFVLLSLNSNAQIRFEKGYFLNNLGERTNCLIKNVGWKSNPTEFEYKLGESEAPQKATTYGIAEFGIEGGITYRKFKVAIDRSSLQLKYLSKTKEPQFKNETLFLKVLVEGDANLYSYEDSSLKRFFISKSDSNAEQLIYKKYLSASGQIGENLAYKNQIWEQLRCEGLSLADARKTAYNEKHLIRYFHNYNSCMDDTYTIAEKAVAKTGDKIHLGIRVGTNSASLDINNTQTENRDADFGNMIGLRFGAQVELVMPFNRNKWSIYINPMYQSYEGEKALINQIVSVDYASIETSLGLRHYFFLSDHSKIFINAGAIFDTPINSKFDYEIGNDYDIESRIGFNLGMGFRFKDSYGLEVVYAPERQLLGNFAFLESGYTSLAFVLSYNFF